MKNRKGYQIFLFVTVCIILNYLGKLLAAKLMLPLWFDSLGTVLTAYVLGPFCGALVGGSVNLLSGIQSTISFVYGITSMAIGVTAGVCAKKGMMEKVFGVLTCAFLITAVSVVISTPLNYFFFGGYTGNVWGDGVIDMLTKLDFNKVVIYTAGEFYVDFLDKVSTTLLLYLMIKLHRIYGKRTRSVRLPFLIVCILSMLAPIGEVSAEKKEEILDYDSYIQTICNGENGLPGGMANDIAQTKDGILWVGTYGGLYRYSGNQFQRMSEFESVRNVNCFLVDEAGRLWIGTNDRGVAICINDQISNVVDKTKGMPADSIRCIEENADGNFYVGTTDELAILSLSGGLAVTDTIPEILFANSITTDENGNVVAVNEEGNAYLVKGTGVLDKLEPEEEIERYTCCRFGENGKVYLGTEKNQIRVYDIESGKFEKIKTIACEGVEKMNALELAENGQMFVCADNGAGYISKADVYKEIVIDAFNSSIEHMLVDYQGNLWFTSSRQGLLRLCKSVFTDVYDKAGLSENIVNTIMEWNGRFYFGTDNGLDVTDKGLTGRVQDNLADALEGVRIRCLMVDSENHMWICTGGNGVIEALRNGEIRTYDSSIGTLGDKFRSVIQLKDGTIAAAGDMGITFIRNGTITGTVGSKDGLVNSKVLTLLELEDGRLLAGTDGNGIAVIEDGKVKNHLKRGGGLSSDVVLRLVPDREGGGTFIVTSNSLCYRKANDSIQVLGSFPYYNNYDMVEGKNGELFVLSSAGIYVVEKDSLRKGKELDFELLDGTKGLRGALTPNSWNYVDDEDNLYLAEDTGVVCVNLDNYVTNTRSYRTLLKYIKVDEENYLVKRGEVTVIPKGTGRIVLKPEIINYSTNNPYISYYLEGFDEEPTKIFQSELSEIVYTNLPAGKYTFHFSIYDNKGVRVITESTYQIEKEKEIYENWWFRLYVIFVLILAIGYVSWLFVVTQLQKTIELQKKQLDLVKQQVEMGNETILTIAMAVDAKDENTSRHSERVSNYSVLIAERLGFSEERKEHLRKTALLHDIGKIEIPDRVLNKPERLTDEEYALMKSHVVRGSKILEKFTLIENVAEGALYHHEKYDGTGYVSGLKGEEIPLNARIIGIADAFDAMTANRVYRNKMDTEYVLNELKKGRGTQFDPELVDIMLELIEEGVIDMTRIYKKKPKA